MAGYGFATCSFTARLFDASLEGNDLLTTPAASYGDCCSACSGNNGCNGWWVAIFLSASLPAHMPAGILTCLPACPSTGQAYGQIGQAHHDEPLTWAQQRKPDLTDRW